MAEGERGLIGVLEYATDLWDEASIARMAGHFQTLLGAIVDHPDRPISALAMLPQAEREQLLLGWNDTSAPYPRELCLHQMFEAQVERTPDTPAVVFDTQSLTYRQLDRRANQLAHHLRNLGVGPDVPVGLYLDRSLDMVVAIFAVLKAGGAYLPLDPSYPAGRAALMVTDAGVKVILTSQNLLSGFLYQAEVVCLDRSSDAMAAYPRRCGLGAVPDNLAYILYTSGSTGRPKGVAVQHDAWLISPRNRSWSRKIAAAIACCNSRHPSCDSQRRRFTPCLRRGGTRPTTNPSDCRNVLASSADWAHHCCRSPDSLLARNRGGAEQGQRGDAAISTPHAHWRRTCPPEISACLAPIRWPAVAPSQHLWLYRSDRITTMV